MLHKSIFLFGILLGTYTQVFGQAKLFTQTDNEKQSFEIPLGAIEINENFKRPQSIEVEPGTVVVLYEKYLNGKTSGRHRLITQSDEALTIGFYITYAIAFSNPNYDVMGFEEPNFGGQSIILDQPNNEISEEFGLSSIYVPKGKKVKLYTINPADYPEQEIDHRPIAPGIRPYIGADIDDKIRYVIVE